MKQNVLLRQFFIWILLANLLGIAFMAGVGSIALKRSTEETVRFNHQHRLSRAAEVVGRHYAVAGGWRPVIENRKLWWGLAAPLSVLPNPDGSLPTEEQMLLNVAPVSAPLTSENFGGPPSIWNKWAAQARNSADGPVTGNPPRHRRDAVDASGRPSEGREPGLGRPGRPGAEGRRRHPSPKEFATSMLLYDPQGELLRGDPWHETKRMTEAEIVVNGEVVGVLKRPLPQREISMIQLGIRNGAMETLLWGGGITIFIALLSAFAISRNLTRPMVKISATLRQLASGNFNSRLVPLKNKAYQRIGDDVNFLGNALAEGQKTRQNWINDISHELRTPVTILNAEIESAEAGIQSSSEDMLRSMREEITQLNTLISDLKTLNHSDLGGLNFERKEIPVQDFLQQYAGKVESAAQMHGLDFALCCDTLTPDCSVLADENRLRQVLDNLLQNTLRYTDTGGSVRLSAKQAGRILNITWEDSDPAVPDESLPRLFERLYRVERSRNRATGGSGLGLSICKSIIDAQDGTIFARHSELGGLAIKISLPLDGT